MTGVCVCQIYKHCKQSKTNILNDQLHYKTQMVFDTIKYANHTSASLIQPLFLEKQPE